MSTAAARKIDLEFFLLDHLQEVDKIDGMSIDEPNFLEVLE
jgi:hypothetical protein